MNQTAHYAAWHSTTFASPPTGELLLDVPRRQGSAMSKPYQPVNALTSWTPEAAASFIAQHEVGVSEAMTRLQDRLRTEHPHGSIFVHRYTADAICRYPCTRP